MAGAVGLFLLYIVVFGRWFQQHLKYNDFAAAKIYLWHYPLEDDIVKAAHNETLGFGKIYYISLPQYGNSPISEMIVR